MAVNGTTHTSPRVGLVSCVPTSERKSHVPLHVRSRQANRQPPGGTILAPRDLPRRQARHRHPARSRAQQGHRLHRGGAPGPRSGGAGPRRDRVGGPPAPPRPPAARRQADRPGALHLPDQPAGQRRDALLPHADVGPGAFPAHRVRPDHRRGLPEVRPHLPPGARHVPVDHAQGARQGGAAQLAGQGRARHLRDGRRPHPRPGRPGRQRHGHPHRQAPALHGCGRRPAAGPAADVPRRRHQQPALPQRPALPRAAAAAPLDRGAVRLRGRVRGGGAGGVPALLHPLRGLDRAATRSPCWPATATRSAATTTTSRARPA